MPTFKLMMARFPGFNQEHPDSTTWYAHTLVEALQHPQIGVGNVTELWIADTPITMSRNLVCKTALQEGCDYVLMLDADMKPDLLWNVDPFAQPFFASSWKFLMKHRDTPCCIAAPYCGASPEQTVFVARWAELAAGEPALWPKMQPWDRYDAATRTGIEEAGGLATGLMLIDCRVLKEMERKPTKQQQPGQWFDYEWDDPPVNSKKCTTEDYYFTRNARICGFPQYVNWDAWAGHWKLQLCGKPQRIGADCVARELREAILHRHPASARLMEVKDGKIQIPNGVAHVNGKVENSQ